MEARPPSVAASAEAPIAATSEQPPDALAADVAKAVRGLRVAAGLSERAAARLLGTSQTQLRRMEDPRYLPSLRSLARVAGAYGHELRISFGPPERQAAKTPKPAASRPRAAAPRAKRTVPARPARGRRRP